MNEYFKDLLEIEKRDSYLPFLKEMKAQISNCPQDNLVNKIRDLIFEKQGFTYSKSYPNFFDFLKKKKGDCLDFAILYNLLFSSLNINSEIMALPFHVILKTSINKKSILIEATEGKIQTREFYMKDRNIHPSSIEQKVYLSPLDRKVILAIYMNRKAREPLRLKHYQEAKEILGEAYKFSNSVPELCFNLGYVYKHFKNLKEAKQLFIKAINLHPNFAQSYNELGLCYLQENLFSTAEKCFRKSLAIGKTIQAEKNLDLLKKYFFES